MLATDLHTGIRQHISKSHFTLRFINFNGIIQNENTSLLHAGNRAFRYGDGLFESIAVCGKSIPFLDDHWSRLTQAARLLSLELTPGFKKHFLEEAITELLSLNAITGNAYARVMLYREGRGRYAPDKMQAGFVIEAEQIPGELFAFNETGLTIGLFADLHKSTDQLSNFKTCSGLVYVLASIYKNKSGWDDCLLINTHSNICDSTNSNVFLVKGNIISTPALSEGCINGVMRKHVMNLAKVCGYAIHETGIESPLLLQADEIFLTNAVSGVRWVEWYAGKQYGKATASRVSGLLRKTQNIPSRTIK